MLKCRDIVQHADALLDQELGFRRRLAVRIHLFMCVHCRRYVRQLRNLLRAIAGMHGLASDNEVAAVVRALPDKHDARR